MDGDRSLKNVPENTQATITTVYLRGGFSRSELGELYGLKKMTVDKILAKRAGLGTRAKTVLDLPEDH